MEETKKKKKTKTLDDLAADLQKLAEEIKAKEEAKKNLEERIERQRFKELNNFLSSNKVDLNAEFYDIALLVKQILDSGITLDELKEMVGFDVSTSSQIETKLKQDTNSAAETTVTEENNEK